MKSCRGFWDSRGLAVSSFWFDYLSPDCLGLQGSGGLGFESTSKYSGVSFQSLENDGKFTVSI